MKVGITVRFQNSYFSGSIPQIACALSRGLVSAGHDVTLLYPKTEADWFIDVHELQKRLPPRKPYSPDDKFDIIVEVVWFLPSEERIKTKSFMFLHHPPIFHDMESSVYAWNAIQRNFKHLHGILTYDHYSEQDMHYLEFLSGVPVATIPYIWDSEPLDIYVTEQSIPSWSESAKTVEALVPKETPKNISWCARIVESNFSNTSHCIIPLNIVTQIRVSGDPIRFAVHNGENVLKSEFFKTNVVKNLLLPDISGNVVPRVRLPDLRKEKTFFISHQRFRPIKSYLLDALYLGIPMIHNCEMLRSLGASYFYQLNQITEALQTWKQMNADYEAKSMFFSKDAETIRSQILNARFSPLVHASKLSDAIQTKRIHPIVSLPRPISETKVLRIKFCEMWDNFQPQHNFFTYLLSWMGKTQDIQVKIVDTEPNLVIFGPYSNKEEEKYPGIPKLFFTGENAPPHDNKDIFLNVGFQYNTTEKYIRLPLWVLEINWFGGDPDLMKNPRTVSLSDALTVNPSVISSKDKFCAFVATNPSNNNRNASFHILNQWKPVDSGGRLFCNLPGGPIPAGLGGGGGELSKIEFYKKYKYVIAFENSSAPGYTTEKIFHAKVAGCIPIYWGDPFVDRDFDGAGFLNANQVSSASDLIDLVKGVESNPERAKKMMSIPALSEFKHMWCRRTMEEVGKRVFQTIFNITPTPMNWLTAESFAKPNTPKPIQSNVTIKTAPVNTIIETPIQQYKAPRIFVTATNSKYAEAAINALASLKQLEPDIPKIVYVWPDVSSEVQAIIKSHGATEIRFFPVDKAPWADFWDPQHFAWKLWLHVDMLEKEAKGSSVLYVDAGTVFACSFPSIWKQIEDHDIYLNDDSEQTNEQWCHPNFVTALKLTDAEKNEHQIWAGSMGFKVGGKYVDTVHKQALTVAQTQRDVIVGEKWSAYNAICMGHRHDQSILSILTSRAGCPRMPLSQFYCDRSMRTAKQWKTPFYVHRGNYREFLPFSDGIGEAYVINLERRKDRLERFKTTNKQIQSRVYLWKAIDGRELALDPNLVHCFRNNDFGWKKAVMGCALSHLGLWEKLANDTLAKSYLIMEDDVVLNERWMILWLQVASSIPENADVIYLGGVLPPNKPVFPQITEPVNKFFARVAKNGLFGGPVRRYFHFCNYAYILTQQGARKLCELVKEKGIFTSGDHMIVNHGDDLLNIYFTTPLIATCFQENDPVYQKSEFNNFNRIDGFDSDLWNNNDRFSSQEVIDCITSELKRGACEPEQSTLEVIRDEEAPKPVVPKPDIALAKPKTKCEITNMWNFFLKHIALRDEDGVSKSLDDIFEHWQHISNEEFNEYFSWFRIFEQLVITKQEMIMKHVGKIRDLMKTTFNEAQHPIVKKILDVVDQNDTEHRPAIVQYERPAEQKLDIYHLSLVNPQFLEDQWLRSLFPKTIVWKPWNSISALIQIPNLVLVYQTIPQSRAFIKKVFADALDILHQHNKKIILIHLSDEFGMDDISMYANPSIQHVIRNYWRPDLAIFGDKIITIPLGYTNGRHSQHYPESPDYSSRQYVWSFSGSLDRPGRSEALVALRKTGNYCEKTKDTWSSPQVLDAKEYNEMMRNSKFIPCFRGSSALESYRFYEALENGAIPIYVANESHNTSDEYKELLGVHPFLAFPSWNNAAETLAILVDKSEVMESHRKKLQVWWSEKKTTLKQQIQQCVDTLNK